MIILNEKLNTLRAVIAKECGVRIATDHRVTPADVATWLVRHQRTAVIDGLTDLVCQEMEQWNDDDRVGRVLRAKPELRGDWESVMRQVSQTLGVPLWYLLDRLNEEESHQCLAAAHFIHELRQRESRAVIEAMQQMEEFIRPITEGHPEMTVKQALSKLKRQTDETIRGLDAEGESGSERGEQL